MALFMGIYYYFGRLAPLGGSVAMFLATGLGPYLAFRNIMKRTQGGYGSNEALLSFPVVKIIDVFVGRSLLELATATLVLAILFGGLIFLGYGPLPDNVLTMLAALLCLFALAFGLGTTLGIVGQFIPAISHLLGVPFRLLYFASGVFYLPDNMAPAIRDGLAWNPVLHGVTLFRMGYYRFYESHMLDLEYLLGWSAVCLLLAFTAERAARRAIRNLP
jgi:capsular polysaccharide transport system permease protein